MQRFLQVPGPMKTLFNQFPLQTYGPVEKRDDALANEFNTLSYAFEGSDARQKSVNDTFKLGVYKVVQDPSTGHFLASDPWCLFTQLSLCKKNKLKLSSNENSKTATGSKTVHSHCVLELSPLASSDRFLPVLVEGYAKRHVRSAAGIYEILSQRFSGAEERMYSLLLDSVVYDCYMAKVLYELTTDQFLELYGGKTSSTAVNPWICHNHRSDLSRRNDFALRHRELVSRHSLPTVLTGRSEGIQQLLSGIDENCLRTLVQFQDLLEKSATEFFLGNTEPSFLDLKLTSYIYCLLLLPKHQMSVADFLRQDCPDLIEHAQRIIQHYH
ncbi:LAME_0F14114g1_1 [Lachancea meyersii CBS 8951]|uniref:LAME_0F14114g1_1 n=1 Tax=Lachancea meyersii CBS 8951 TaxID=1266667 RepID=A0A1G4JXV9_9SACH|nr:LAME_0F14114g1_1 [Lachancea meyersii CBS 8951]